MNTQISQALRAAIADDAFAASFQTLGQYRQALIRILDGQAAGLTDQQPPRSTGYRCAACCAPAGAQHVAACPEAGLSRAATVAIDMLAELDPSKMPLAVPAAIGVLRTGLADNYTRLTCATERAAAPADLTAEQARSALLAMPLDEVTDLVRATHQPSAQDGGGA
ncbi:hypothetical protein ACSUZJ_07285 [Telluria sp. B2]